MSEDKIPITDEDRKRGYVILKCEMPVRMCWIDGVMHASKETHEREILFHIRKDSGDTSKPNPDYVTPKPE